MWELFQVDNEVTPIAPEVLGFVGGLPISNSFMATILVGAIVGFVALLVVPRFANRPGMAQNVLEMVYEGMTGLINQIAANTKMARDIVPMVTALFVFIGLSNFIGIVPGLSSITWEGTSVFRSPTSDFNTTLGLALAVVLLIQIDSVKEWGVRGYIGRFIKIKELIAGIRGGVKTTATTSIEFFVGLLDIFAELAKVVSLSFRLFGNMFAGEVLMVLILSAFAFFIPAVWLSMSMLFALVQAIVFGALATAYYTLSMKEEVSKRADNN